MTHAKREHLDFRKIEEWESVPLEEYFMKAFRLGYQDRPRVQTLKKLFPDTYSKAETRWQERSDRLK
jgi:hypothetical protein